MSALTKVQGIQKRRIAKVCLFCISLLAFFVTFGFHWAHVSCAQPAPLRLVLLAKKNSTVKASFQKVLGKSAQIVVISPETFLKNAQNQQLTPHNLFHKNNLIKHQPAMARAMSTSQVEVVLIIHQAQSSRLWVIGPTGRLRGEIKIEGGNDDDDAKKHLAAAFKLSSGSVLAWRKTRAATLPKRRTQAFSIAKKSVIKSVRRGLARTGGPPKLSQKKERPKASSFNKDQNKKQEGKSRIEDNPKSTLSLGSSKRTPKTKSSYFGVQLAPALTFYDEVISTNTLNQQNQISAQLMTGISLGAFLILAAADRLSFIVSLGFDYVFSEAINAVTNETFALSRSDFSLNFQSMFTFNKHRLIPSFGLGLSSGLGLELSPDTFTSFYALSVRMGLQYVYQWIPGFFSVDVHGDFGIPLYGDYGPFDDSLTGGFEHHLGVGAQIKVLSWLQLFSSVTTEYRELKYSYTDFDQNNLDFVSMQSSTLIRIGAVLFW